MRLTKPFPFLFRTVSPSLHTHTHTLVSRSTLSSSSFVFLSCDSLAVPIFRVVFPPCAWMRWGVYVHTCRCMCESTSGSVFVCVYVYECVISKVQLWLAALHYMCWVSERNVCSCETSLTKNHMLFLQKRSLSLTTPPSRSLSLSLTFMSLENRKTIFTSSHSHPLLCLILYSSPK